MSYDTKKALSQLIRKCTALPVTEIKSKLAFPSHCECKKPSCLILQSPPEWEGTPVKCGDCGKSVPLYRLKKSVPEMEFDELLMWRRLRRGRFTEYEAGRRKYSPEYAQSYTEAAQAYAALKGCASDLSLEGRRIAGQIELETGILTLYPLFSHYEKYPEFCPQCGSRWINPYTDAVKYHCLCRACRLVM